MKIIATIDGGTFIAELSVQEIDFLAGKTIGDKGYYDHNRTIRSGTTFNIVKAFEQIHRNNNRRHQIENVKQTLKMLLIGLEMVDPLIEEPKPEDLKEA
jgi:hypothetical protein